MFNNTEWLTENSNGKFRINSRAIYRDLSSKIVNKLDQNLSVSEILDWMRNETSKAFREKYSQNPQVGALNKATGGWNELMATSLLSEIVLNINQENEVCIAVFSMPNSRPQIEGVDQSYSSFLNLFKNEYFANINNASAKIKPFKDNIFMPSPDDIIAVIEDEKNSKIVNSLLEQQARDPDTLALYNSFKGKLGIKEVKAAISLKTSNRPDRRYQPLFEAAMVKAMGYVLQQIWKYFMVVSELTPADRTIFSTAIAPHGVALEKNLKLVDGTYLYSRKADLLPLVNDAIKK
ncbi:Cfr10I/Bse634I family restriction endonuclease [Nodularia spumigena CS-584]|uniref:Type-2 restriction enzyme Cfr10I n=1 Tax=Nodularia spumigena UHCC 0039 TaxID=1914872 RepID=A0A2S0Q084_NODSP|nr:Cfr10I/Bse634I family restriction endonuclease [Nodularia spumigena]AHJ29563.1 deoxyribose-phosphate aldolase [Nodularia spumigena CCY9414]AVZ30196.1 type-2 restriction enzyme Cfr10I [Nodularia spumigena UHCC 0039]EAW42886.1 deoxyribose-phosphate aldolase [Nodularia spumigena CCY9414]MDB9384338.1 Cfr10I/Bse634I family restriction endonuclease [Nodularia spumigena CS-584]